MVHVTAQTRPKQNFPAGWGLQKLDLYYPESSLFQQHMLTCWYILDQPKFLEVLPMLEPELNFMQYILLGEG